MSYLSRIDHAFSDALFSHFRRTGGMSSLVTATAASVLLTTIFKKPASLFCCFKLLLSTFFLLY